MKYKKLIWEKQRSTAQTADGWEWLGRITDSYGNDEVVVCIQAVKDKKGDYIAHVYFGRDGITRYCTTLQKAKWYCQQLLYGISQLLTE